MKPTAKPLAIALAAYLTLSPISSFAAETFSMLQLQQQAATFYRSGQYEAAAQIYQKLSGLQPRDIDILRDLMWAHWKAQHAEQAIDVANKIVSQDPNDVEALGILAKAYEAVGDKKSAMENYQKVLEKGAVNAQVKSALARLNVQEGHLDEAEKLLSQAQKDSPEDPELYATLANVRILSGKYKESAQAWSKAVELSPGRKDYQFQYAYALYQSGQVTPAFRIFNEQLKDKMLNRRVLDILVNHALKNGRLAHAAGLLEKYLDPADQEGDQTRLLRLARIYEELGQTDDMVFTTNRLLDVNPDQVQAMFIKAHAMFDHERDYAEAERLFQKAAAAMPENPKIYPKLATAQFIQGKFRKSAQNWAKLEQLVPDNNLYKFKYAEALYFDKQYDDALRRFSALLKVPDQRDAALDFIIGDKLVTSDLSGAVKILEQQNDPARGLQLATIHRDMGQNLKSLATVDKYLASNPNDAQAWLLRGNVLVLLNRKRDALRVYQKLHAANPTSTFFLLRLAEAEYRSGKLTKAIETVRAARKIDTTNPYLLLKEAAYLHDNGNYKEAKEMVIDWLKKNKEPSLAVFVYHGLTPYARDPLLSHPTHLTTDVFEQQLRAFKKAGFTAVTCEQVNAWMKGQGKLPPHPILIAFDDGRQSSFSYGDPVLKATGMRATAFISVWNTERNIPNYADWGELKKWRDSGRWEIEAHGDNGHTYITLDEQGNKKLFLIGRKWLADKKRSETIEEWSERVNADHQSAKEKLERNLDIPAPIAFAFPEGDYGQFNMSKTPPSTQNVQLANKYYDLAFYEDEFGLNVQSKTPGLLTRFIPLQSHTGEDLVQHVLDRNPYAIARQTLIKWAVWEGKTREALAWLDELKKGGVSQYCQLSNDAYIHASRSNMSTAEALMEEAARNSNEEQKKDLLSSLHEKKRIEWEPFFEYVEETRDRYSWIFGQTLDFLRIGDSSVRAIHRQSRYEEEIVPDVNETAVGLGFSHAFGLYNYIDLQAMGHNFSDNIDSTYSAQAAMHTNWTDSVRTRLLLLRGPVYTARALNEEINRRLAEAEIKWDFIGLWNTSLLGRRTVYTDDNGRLSAVFEFGRYIGRINGPRVGYRFTADDAENNRKAYYTPDSLQQHQLGFEIPLTGNGNTLSRLSYWGGIGKELHSNTLGVHSVELDLRRRWTQRFWTGLFAGYDSSPTYESFHAKISLDIRI